MATEVARLAEIVCSGAKLAVPRRSVRRTPPPLNEVVSLQMRSMPRASTTPELAVRRELHRQGLRFRVNYKLLPGRPDIALARVRLAVFIDGCFWHRCPVHGTLPRNNRDWWHEKLTRNVERDGEKDTALAELGWQVMHFWEHEMATDVAGAVVSRWRSLSGRHDT